MVRQVSEVNEVVGGAAENAGKFLTEHTHAKDTRLSLEL